MCEAIKLTVKLITDIHNIEKAFAETSSELSMRDMETQDILHEIEFGKFNASQGYAFAKKLKQIRQERRKVKDENQELMRIHSFIDSNKHVFDGLKKIQSSIQKNITNYENRTYTQKTDVLKEEQSNVK